MSVKTRIQQWLKLATRESARGNNRGRRIRGYAARVESLESRTLLTAYTVTNLNDAGTGSLRDAISLANGNSGTDTITFTTSGTITLSSGELAITDSVTITGPGADKLAVSGGHTATRIFLIDNANASLIDVAISNITIRDGGDGITSINGAGVRSSENLTLRGVAVTGNDAANLGGGGIQIFGGNFVLQDSTVANNRANQGGGIELFGNSATVINTTISGNQANGHGGGLIALIGATTVRNSTIANNRCDADGSGGGVNGGAAGNVGLLTLHNTIVAGNFQGTGTTPWDASQLTASSSHNLIGFAGPDVWITDGVNGNIVGVNGSGNRDVATILNTTLADNGGLTQTHALVTGSAGIDSGSNGLAIDANGAALTHDQRGGVLPRIFNSTVDIGAYESVFSPIVVSIVTDEQDNDLSSGDISLREAIALANLSPGANMITFAATTNAQPFNFSSATPMTITDTLTITGNGAASTVIDPRQNSRIFTIGSGDVTLNRLTLTHGRGLGTGGAILNSSSGTLTISQCTLSDNIVVSTNSGAQGGAIFAGSGAVTISQCTLSGNTGSSDGTSSQGGAIFASSGAVTISQSTLSGNSAAARSNDRVNGRGGAIYALSGAVTISQSTLSGNQAEGGAGSNVNGRGGAIFALSGAVTISQSTLSGNSSGNVGGAIYTSSGAVKTIRNSIVAGNTSAVGSDLYFPGSFTVTSSLIGRRDGTSLTVNVGSTPDSNGNFVGGFNDATKLDPKLGPLVNNGGPAKTHALLTGSLAIDHGDNAQAVDVSNGNTALTTDQRGAPFTRILDGDNSGVPPAIVDMGAFEFSGLRLLSPSPNAFNLRPTFTWTPIAGATSYTIQINNESTNVPHFHDATTGNASYTPTVDLAIGKFKMWVRPNFAAGPGNWSAPHLFNNLTKPTWQTMPRTQLTSRPMLNWNALPGAVKYDLWIDNFSTGQLKVIRQEVTGTSFTPAADLPMGIYRCWIRGIDAKGNLAGWSVLQEFLVVPGPTPVGPLSATFDRTPTFAWNPVTGAASYELFARNQNTGAMVINGQSVMATNFTPTTNLTDGPYRWWTLAVSPANIGPIRSGGSNPTDIYVGGRPTIIAPVAGSSTSDRTPTFTWRAVDGAASYQLTVNRTSAPQVNVISQTGLTSTTFTTTTNLTAGNYRAWVRAVSTTGELSPWSIDVNFTVTATVPAINSPETDLKLTGLLASALAQPDDSDTESSPMLIVEHPQTEAAAHDPDFEVAIPRRPSNLFVRPDQGVLQLNDLEVDRLMVEFALHEFTTAVIPQL